jgi:hypothetical protein
LTRRPVTVMFWPEEICKIRTDFEKICGYVRTSRKSAKYVQSRELRNTYKLRENLRNTYGLRHNLRNTYSLSENLRNTYILRENLPNTYRPVHSGLGGSQMQVPCPTAVGSRDVLLENTESILKGPRAKIFSLKRRCHMSF